MSVTVVIPSIGRPSLGALLDALRPVPRVLVVLDRGEPPDRSWPNVTFLPGPGRGPAAARNVGWRATGTEWVAFLDDDVLPPPDWYAGLCRDLADLPPEVAGSQGRIVVPLPAGRAPTDWERNVAGLQRARWATADLAYRRSVLAEVGGFDERFPRAYREDADLGLRVVQAGYRIVPGQRSVAHPVRPADRWVSLRLQRGNADDPLMRALHGPDWQQRAGVPAGRRPWHAATSAAAAAAAAGLLTRRPGWVLAGGTAYLGLVVDFAWRRIRPGPRTREELLTMVATSPVLPLAATWHWLAGQLRARRLA